MYYPGELLPAPATAIVELAEAKDHLRISYDAEDADLQQKLDAAIGWIEEQSGRALAERVATFYFDRLPPGRRVLQLPRAPLQSVDEIRYTDGAGDAQTIDAAAIAAGYTVAAYEEPGFILPNYGAVWPDARRQPASVEVDATVGWADGTQPDWAKTPVLLLLGHLFESREETVEKALQRIPLGVRDLIEGLKFDHLIDYDPERAPSR